MYLRATGHKESKAGTHSLVSQNDLSHFHLLPLLNTELTALELFKTIN